jgi:hypothetical protein
MTTREHLSVFGIVLIGLVPSYFTFHYLSENPSILGGGSIFEQSASGAISATAVTAFTQNPKIETYQSRPQKETTGLCTHSYYMSFALVFSANGTFTLVKSCESARDAVFAWFGVASTTWDVSTDTRESQTRKISITGDSKGTYESPLQLEISREGTAVRVLQTELSEIATTTVFVRVPTSNQ